LPTPGARTLFDDADDLRLKMPASCRRSGRCRECVVEVTAGAGLLGPRTEAESFLRDPYRLACQAVVVEPDAAVEFEILRRRCASSYPSPSRERLPSTPS
jgi:ferredoxin